MRARFLAGLVLAPALALGGAAAGQDAATAKQDFELVNKSGVSVVALNASPSKSKNWGSNILKQKVLASGESAQITFNPNSPDSGECLWDLRASYADDDTTEMAKVDLCEVGTVTLNP